MKEKRALHLTAFGRNAKHKEDTFCKREPAWRAKTIYLQVNKPNFIFLMLCAVWMHACTNNHNNPTLPTHAPKTDSIRLSDSIPASFFRFGADTSVVCSLAYLGIVAFEENRSITLRYYNHGKVKDEFFYGDPCANVWHMELDTIYLSGGKTPELIIWYGAECMHRYGGPNLGGFSYSLQQTEIWDINRMRPLFAYPTFQANMSDERSVESEEDLENIPDSVWEKYCDPEQGFNQGEDSNEVYIDRQKRCIAVTFKGGRYCEERKQAATKPVIYRYQQDTILPVR